MFGLGWPEIMVCALVGFFVFGPERLPGVARDAGRMVRQLRGMAQGVTDEFKEHLPDSSEFGLQDLRELRDLHPKSMVRTALFEDGFGEARTRRGPAASAAVTSTPRYDVDAT